MTLDQAQSVAVRLVAAVAPELDPETLDPSARLREDLDLDSLDFLTLLEAVKAQTGLDVPESDYPLITSVGGLASYLAERS